MNSTGYYISGAFVDDSSSLISNNLINSPMDKLLLFHSFCETDAFPVEIDLPTKKSTGLSLLKFAGIWEGDDMGEILELIKTTRSKTIF